ncbi:MAG: translation initiation factor IF-2 [Melioribacteraceae bacterium]|nr:translation initiation factor IF-2 [Melioribacteraceae bacterium]
MSEAAKNKKLKIYKLAAEYNLSSESIIDHLVKKGFEIKNHMTTISDEMLAEINSHFKKDIEKQEKHKKKIDDYKKKVDRAEPIERKQEELPPAPAAEPEPVKEEASDDVEETISEPVIDKKIEIIEESPVIETSDTIEIEETEIKSETEPKEANAPEAEIESKEIKENVVPVENEISVIEEEAEPIESQQTPKAPETVEPIKSFRTKAEIELDTRKKGLTIVGKIDLNRKRKDDRGARPDQQKQDGNKTTQPNSNIVTKKVGEVESEADKKKKKKVLKAKKKTKTGDEPADPIVAKKKKKIKKLEVDKREVEEAIKRTMLSIDESAMGERANARKKKRKEKADIQEKIQEQKEIEKFTLKVTEFISVNELANMMKVPVTDVIQKCLGLGIMVSINQRLDIDTITLVADEFEFNIELQEEFHTDIDVDEDDAPETLKPRPAVVTIMGHVDHGKTSLLDYIRRENVVAGESGGITQHIGAYKVIIQDGREIAFLDTPGHEAFTAMRARGAKVTDIVVLIVAADDAVMPQTVEAINHAQAANVPIIIAINKIDKPNSNIEKIRQQLADRNVLVEEWGGKYQCVEISAKTGLNVELLLEKLVLEAELLELKANPDREARGTIIESQLDKGRGITATVLVQKGTLRIGDPFVAGVVHGRVRAMFDERNNKVAEAGPSTPVLVLGFESAPQAGDTFISVESERVAREVAIKRSQVKREQDHKQVKLITLDEIANQISIGGVKELPLIVKGDVDGSIEALSDSFMKIANKEVNVRVIHKGVGAISEGDVLLAAASNAIIIGFHVRPNVNARKLAETQKVDIRLYNVIYDAINEVRSAIEGMLSPTLSEEMVATVEVRQTFKVPKAGTIAGCYVTDGKITRLNKIRLIRDGIVIYEGDLSTLKRFKDDVKEVDAGYECGLSIASFNDIKVGDIIEAYKIIETKKKLV